LKPGSTLHRVGVLNEKPLHASLKEWYAQPGDLLESSVDGFVVDIVRGRLLIEIQTRNFAAIRRKLAELTVRHPVRLVYPIAREKWIVKLAEDGHTELSRRRSPKRGAVEHLFEELISFPGLLLNPNFSVELLFIREEETRLHDPVRAWRRKGWLTHERKLLGVMDRRLLSGPSEISVLLPSTLREPFTTSDLAIAIAKPRRLAQKMVYCLRLNGCITQTGRIGNAILYSRAASADSFELSRAPRPVLSVSQ
jgi:hypothetical protein